MSKEIPFTVMHEDMMRNSLKAINQNAQAIEKNAHAIMKNSEDLHKLGLEIEEIKSSNAKILEVVIHTGHRLNLQDEKDKQIENHEHRISAIEHHIKSDF